MGIFLWLEFSTQGHKLLVSKQEVDNLPDHFHDAFDKDFLKLLAALRLHGFHILRADQASPIVNSDNLWIELSHPSVLIYSPDAPKRKLEVAEPGSLEYTQLTNEVIKANLREQQRLLVLMEEFYKGHYPPSFDARLIVETIDLGESCLRPQGASVRVILEESVTQEMQDKEFSSELIAFTTFLIDKLTT